MQNEGAVTAITAKRLTLALCAAGVIGGAVGAIAVNHNNAMAEGAVATAAAPAAAAPVAASADPQVALPDFTSIVKRNGPAVVNIRVVGGTKTSLRSQRNAPDLDEDDPFFQFFRQFGMPNGPRGHQRGGGNGAPTMMGEGSGFIVSPDGIILTNAHVVRDADEVTVKLQDRREYRAKVLGSDPKTDVAVLKIDAKNLPIVKIGDPNGSKVGQWVVAIGSPYGFDNTVTSGIISAKSRSLPNENYTPFIQTDVPVNPGNSGGPLFNLQGEVIGINSMIYSQTGGFQGLSFAIPINEAIKVKDALVKTGHVDRGRLGVTVQGMNQTLANSFGMKTPQGALVSSVEPGGPAAKAGLQPGDVIVSLNGTPVADSTALPSQVAGLAPGSQAKMQVWRDKGTKDLTVTIGALADAKTASANGDNGGASAQDARLGVAVRPLTPEEKQDSSLSRGLIVQQASGAAANAGIQPGDVILAVNGQPVTSVQQLKSMVAHAGDSLALLIQRDDAQIFVPVDLG
jgi:serine protease Do